MLPPLTTTLLPPHQPSRSTSTSGLLFLRVCFCLPCFAFSRARCLYQQRLLCHHNRSAMESITSRAGPVQASSVQHSSSIAGAAGAASRRRPSCGMSVYINFVAQRGKLSSVQKNEMTNEVCRLMAAEMRAGQAGAGGRAD